MTIGQLHGDGYHCPHSECGKRLDGFASVDRDAVPQPGDYSICTYCHCPLVFVEGGVRALTREEFDAFTPEEKKIFERAASIIDSVRAARDAEKG